MPDLHDTSLCPRALHDQVNHYAFPHLYQRPVHNTYESLTSVADAHVFFNDVCTTKHINVQINTVDKRHESTVKNSFSKGM